MRAVTENQARAEYYEQKAAEARAKANAMTDLEARRTMGQVAQLWEMMSQNAKRSRPLRRGKSYGSTS